MQGHNNFQTREWSGLSSAVLLDIENVMVIRVEQHPKEAVCLCVCVPADVCVHMYTCVYM